MSQKYEKLKTLLMELFQLDQPDLDFGLYRIMHAKSAEVTQFLDKDLLPQVQTAFAQYKTADKAELEKELAKVIAGIEAAGMDPKQSPKVADLSAKLKTDAVDVGAIEGEVYDHLFSFFRRYYSEGDFLAKRVYKQGVYAIPYEGEEVALHWANKDQYYIKTSEYLRDYAFRLRPNDDKNPMRVHFRLTDAAEEEHGNVKAGEGRERRFKLAESNAATAEGGELVVRFTYLANTAKQKDLNTAAEAAVLGSTDAGLVEWIAALAKPAPTEKEPKRTVLAKQLQGYTDRNTFDYFIHKDLGAFLRRELDFYIKNEVMHLDDVENETAPRVEQYLSKIKIIRKIAGKIITFLAQLEDFQKKLWLKKKFVVETQWCIRIGCIPEVFHAAIAANEAQRDEWVKLFAIDEIKGDLVRPGYSNPVTPAFLKGYPTLVVDTRHFDAGFTARLLEAVGDMDALTDGVLFHSENFQALQIAASRFRERARCVYMDPPYNTGTDGFAYKDTYQHSSWLAMLDDRIRSALGLLSSNGVVISSIDDRELAGLRVLMDQHVGSENRVGSLVWKGATDNNPTRIAVEHEYLVVHAKSKGELAGDWSTADNETKQLLLNAFERIRATTRSLAELGRLFADFTSEHKEQLGDLYRYKRIDENGPYAARRNLENPGKPGYVYDVIHPTTRRPCERPHWGWRFPESSMTKLLADGRIIFGETETKIPELKVYLRDVTFPLRSVFAMDARKGSNDLDRLFGSRDVFKNPKPVEVLEHVLPFVTSRESLFLDLFAGSGTSGHAVVGLNRADGGRRKFVLVEMGEYFDTVLLPRIKKVTFSPGWKDGKPKSLATPEEAERSPRIVKVVRLESYEDTLNNLETRRTDTQQLLLDTAQAQGADGLKEQYLLNYLLDVETRGSQSLLNVQAFSDPTAYKLKVKRPGSDESREVNVDLIETFNWLVGLTVQHIAAPQAFSAAFEHDSEKRLQIKGRLKPDDAGPFWFRRVEGLMPDGRKTLIVWRKLTDNVEQDNAVLDRWMTDKLKISTKDFEFDVIYVNGGNNLENLKTAGDRWKVRLIEEDFHRLMFATEGV